MITNKDIRVENGFLIINGDKYPLDGQSPEAIMEIVKDNSDTTPTENSDAPITSGGVFTSIFTLAEQLGNFKCFANSLAINDDAVKQLLTDADNASITMAIINPTISGDDTPFTGKAYFVISVKYDATRGSQYAIQIIGGTGKKQRLFDTTWGAWS